MRYGSMMWQFDFSIAKATEVKMAKSGCKMRPYFDKATRNITKSCRQDLFRF